ncbi:hypothetical protein [Streptomyces sp. G45]|uniref:hypothetical protein n=1 Tax=Streptomyces sp. G45 TaxID=3406627 RepID=UPI003C23E535
MSAMPGGLSLVLYSAVALCGIALLALSIASSRGHRNAGFASKAQLRRSLSARAVLRATEIRPSLAKESARTRSDANRLKPARSRTR